MAAFQPGDAVWAHTGTDESFAVGTVDHVEAHKGKVAVVMRKGVIEVKEGDVHRMNAPKQDGVPDNTYLRELNEATLLHNIRVRYNSNDDAGCYSSTGHILIAVNPFRELTCYTEAEVRPPAHRAWVAPSRRLAARRPSPWTLRPPVSAPS